LNKDISKGIRLPQADDEKKNNKDLITTSKKDYEYLVKCRKAIHLIKLLVKEV